MEDTGCGNPLGSMSRFFVPTELHETSFHGPSGHYYLETKIPRFLFHRGWLANFTDEEPHRNHCSYFVGFG